MEEEIRPQARGCGKRNRRIARHGPGRIQLVAPDPVVPHVRRVTDDRGVRTARKIIWRCCQKVGLEAVGLNQLLTSAHGVGATWVNVDSIYLLPCVRNVRFRQNPHRCLKKGATTIAGVKDWPSPVGQSPSHQHGRQVIRSVVDAEEASRTDVGRVLGLARRLIPTTWRTRCTIRQAGSTRLLAQLLHAFHRNSIPFSLACHSSSSTTSNRITLLRIAGANSAQSALRACSLQMSKSADYLYKFRNLFTIIEL